MRLTAPLLFATGLLAACASAPPVPADPCRQYCLSREDGYQWAQRAHLTEKRDCNGYPAAFVSGCLDAVIDYQQSLAPGREGL